MGGSESSRADPPRSWELRIDALAAGGDGVGRTADGRVVFVPFTAPGDRVRVRVVDERARFARGRLEALLEPGADRTAPVCPVFGSCGGCRWQHVSYEAQLAAKRSILAEALQRIGKLALPASFAMVASPASYGYRGRTRLRVEGGRVGYRRLRSHALCAVTRCPLLVPALDRELARLAARPPGGDADWELVAGDGDQTRASELPAPASPSPTLAIRVGKDRLEVSPGVFLQANALLLEPLAQAVVGAAGEGRSALELHAGAGFFTLGLARRFERVFAVEADPATVADLRRNLAAAGLGNVRLLPTRVEQALGGRELRRARPEVIVLDPPRRGLGPRDADRLAALGARRIVYLSCDPATLARDLARLAARGMRLVLLTGFDLFPQTPHVEALAVLERAADRAP